MHFHWQGIATSVASFVIIGIFHPIVIQCEYHFTERVWPVFLIIGLLFLGGAAFTSGFLSVLLALIGVACLWSIKELKEQTKRVARGWFPMNPKRR